ncbi:sensor histidine kinase [Zobellia barbeyronii]|uniref:histidine kinase n=1 Tax=Zobellia barbeyronii TaxID=2748009 RepID=A0ABS5WD32_9FLAO|nr:histidine kinase [Zobellia barbeyronii]MBT2161310.1 two-component sensor histidine kinase [Zobellia barbeyronii]
MGENSLIALIVLFNLIFIIFIGGIIIFIREYRVKKKLHIEQVETINTLHQKELLENKLEIQEQTMRYIGQEIHDNIGQKLTLASIYLQQLEHANKAPQINENITSINSIISQSLTELRQLSKSLTDDTILEQSISELLTNECKKVRDLKICKVKFDDDISCDINSYQVKSIVLRITQEFFQNSIKHANCKNIQLKLSANTEYVYLKLKDDGIGFSINEVANNGIGLKNMKKRTQILKGHFNLKSTLKLGTELNVEIPIK